MEYNDFVDKYFDPNDSDSGFNEMLFERQAHLKNLKERLKKYYLSEVEIDDLFKIITKAEMEMEKVKRSYSFDKNKEQDIIKMSDKLVLIQKKMQLDFESKLSKIVKKKYEKAKKLAEKLESNEKKAN